MHVSEQPSIFQPHRLTCTTAAEVLLVAVLITQATFTAVMLVMALMMRGKYLADVVRTVLAAADDVAERGSNIDDSIHTDLGNMTKSNASHIAFRLHTAKGFIRFLSNHYITLPRVDARIQSTLRGNPILSYLKYVVMILSRMKAFYIGTHAFHPPERLAMPLERQAHALLSPMYVYQCNHVAFSHPIPHFRKHIYFNVRRSTAYAK